MNELLAELYDRMEGQPSTDLRFFTPNEHFWSLMEEFKDKLIVEFGCGKADTLQEAKERGFRWAGCDLRRTPELIDGVYMLNALRMPLSKDMMCIACRPDHSGWVEPALRRALEFGCTVIYVSKETNMDRDIGGLLDNEIFFRHMKVGKEDEGMVIFPA